MSPTILREKGYRFFFFSREESRRHVHVSAANGEAKFWLEPTIALARNHRLTRSLLKKWGAAARPTPAAWVPRSCGDQARNDDES